jgi:hypothetical protein
MTAGLAERVSVVGGDFYCYRQQRPGQDVAADDARLFVHFPIFRSLREFLRGNPGWDLERNIKRVQIATHYWGSSKIKPELRGKYLAAAAYDIFNNTIALSTADIFRTTLAHGRGLLPWLAKVYGLRRQGRAAWEELQDFQG